ncbi:unknown [Anaerotruncus sp. CAG:390]|nr:unknown [Anaerotruncus sp. CAG:390]
MRSRLDRIGSPRADKVQLAVAYNGEQSHGVGMRGFYAVSQRARSRDIHALQLAAHELVLSEIDRSRHYRIQLRGCKLCVECFYLALQLLHLGNDRRAALRQLADVLRFYLTRGLRKQSILFAELLQRFKTGHALYAAYAGGNGGFAYDVEKSYLCGVVNVRTAAEFG